MACLKPFLRQQRTQVCSVEYPGDLALVRNMVLDRKITRIVKWEEQNTPEPSKKNEKPSDLKPVKIVLSPDTPFLQEIPPWT